MTGEVVEFDEDGGYGTVRADDGSGYFFHCTAITDGTRTIDVGTAVRFEIEPGRRGQWEGSRIEPVSSAG